MDNISEDANACADYIEEHGWTHGFENGERVCALAAIHKVKGVGSSNIYVPIQESNVGKALGEYVGDQEIWHWNDRPGRTQEEVIQAFRDVAIKHQPDEMSADNG